MQVQIKDLIHLNLDLRPPCSLDEFGCIIPSLNLTPPLLFGQSDPLEMFLTLQQSRHTLPSPSPFPSSSVATSSRTQRIIGSQDRRSGHTETE